MGLTQVRRSIEIIWAVTVHRPLKRQRERKKQIMLLICLFLYTQLVDYVTRACDIIMLLVQGCRRGFSNQLLNHNHVGKMEVPYTDQWYSIVISTQWLYTITYQCYVNSHCVFMLHALSTGNIIQVGLWAGDKWSGEGNGRFKADRATLQANIAKLNKQLRALQLKHDDTVAQLRALQLKHADTVAQLRALQLKHADTVAQLQQSSSTTNTN